MVGAATWTAPERARPLRPDWPRPAGRWSGTGRPGAEPRVTVVARRDEADAGVAAQGQEGRRSARRCWPAGRARLADGGADDDARALRRGRWRRRRCSPASVQPDAPWAQASASRLPAAVPTVPVPPAVVDARRRWSPTLADTVALETRTTDPRPVVSALSMRPAGHGARVGGDGRGRPGSGCSCHGGAVAVVDGPAVGPGLVPGERGAGDRRGDGPARAVPVVDRPAVELRGGVAGQRRRA